MHQPHQSDPPISTGPRLSGIRYARSESEHEVMKALSASTESNIEFPSIKISGNRSSSPIVTDHIFHECKLPRVIFSRMNLRSSSFLSCTVSDTKFTRSILTHTLFRSSHLERTDFFKCDLSSATFDGCDFTDVRFQRCKLFHTAFSSMSISGKTFSNNTRRIKLDAVLLTDVAAIDMGLTYPADLNGCILQNVAFTKCNFNNIRFRGSKIKGSIVIDEKDASVRRSIREQFSIADQKYISFIDTSKFNSKREGQPISFKSIANAAGISATLLATEIASVNLANAANISAQNATDRNQFSQEGGSESSLLLHPASDDTILDPLLDSAINESLNERKREAKLARAHVLHRISQEIDSTITNSDTAIVGFLLGIKRSIPGLAGLLLIIIVRNRVSARTPMDWFSVSRFDIAMLLVWVALVVIIHNYDKWKNKIFLGFSS